jgi:hypothetical protein
MLLDGADILIAQGLTGAPRHYLQELARVIEIDAGATNFP